MSLTMVDAGDESRVLLPSLAAASADVVGLGVGADDFGGSSAVAGARSGLVDC